MIKIDSIICGNCIDVMRGIEDGIIDLTVTSPPYDNLRDYKGYTFDFESIAKELYRITKQGGIVVWVVGDQTINGSETGTSFRQALYFKEIEFNLHDTMIYEKKCPKFGSNNRYHSAFEYMFILAKGSPETHNLLKDRRNIEAGGLIVRKKSKRNKDGTLSENSAYIVDPNRTYKEFGLRNNIWRWGAGDCKPPDGFAYQHPAVFPEQLARDHIISWSNEGDLVFDPMCGSGTTCKMAYELKRHWIGVDISQEYVDIASRRVEEAQRQLRLF